MPITHAFHNPHADGTDTTLTRPSDWNANHTGTLTQAQSHDSPDTDSAPTALHHTLGIGANQALAGNTHIPADQVNADWNAISGVAQILNKPILAQTTANVLHKWLNSYNATTGLFTQTQPDYSDLTNLPQLAQTIASAAHKFLNSYTASTGLFTAAQPDWSDLTNVPATFPIATPGTLTATTTNNASGAHTHAVTNSSNPGAAVSLLSSDALGQLQLVNQLLIGYGDYTAITTPASPIANHIRLYAETNATHGHTRPAYLDDDGLEIVVGRDSFIVVKNTSGGTINIGQAVYVTGSTGNVPNVSLAKADSLTTLPALGVAMASILNNAFGYIMVVGILSGFDTSAFVSGDQLYVSTTTAGALTKTRPTNPNYVAKIGEVLVSAVGAGSLLVDTAPFIGNRETGTSITPWTAAGVVNAVTGYQVNGAATAANYLRGDGTNFVSHTLDWGDLTGVPATFPIATPGTLTVSSTNNAAGAHTHAITSSSNPGVAAAILATSAYGAITLNTNAVGTAGLTSNAIHTHSVSDSSGMDAIIALVQVGVATGITNTGLQDAVTGTGLATGAGTGTMGRVAGGHFVAQADNLFAGTTDLAAIHTNCVRNGGTVNNGYSVYVEGPTGTIANKYGIYQVTAGISNYFASPANFNAGLSIAGGTTYTAISSNPGAAAAILATDASGFVTVQKATAKPSTTAGIQLDPNAATGNFTLSLSPANLTAARRMTFPDRDLNLDQWILPMSNAQASYPAADNTYPFFATILRTLTTVSLYINVYVATTNNGSNYWTIRLEDVNHTGASNLASVNTSAMSANTWTILSMTSFNPTTSGATDQHYDIRVQIAAGVPGSIYVTGPILTVAG